MNKNCLNISVALLSQTLPRPTVLQLNPSAHFTCISYWTHTLQVIGFSLAEHLIHTATELKKKKNVIVDFYFTILPFFIIE